MKSASPDRHLDRPATKSSTGSSLKRTLGSLLLAAGLMGGFVLGGGSCDEADEFFDCQSVCSRYQGCFNKDYDVGACRSRCRTNSDADKDYRSKANQCEACIDEMSCASATFNCGAKCVGIVP